MDRVHGGQHLDLWSFFKIRVKGGQRDMRLRALGSTVIGQLIDTAIFMTIAFYGSFPLLPAIVGRASSSWSSRCYSRSSTLLSTGACGH